ncbi:MAG: membrane protein insertase YidC [Acidisphaera sp.]|nr:membrane protein insertase YidC [Acidisphaera sp.]MBV9811785.1 membrane protein insertase YidC [Acetobacteraceae bacterium]
MEQKRLFLAIGISVAILMIFQIIMPRPQQRPHPATQAAVTDNAAPATPTEHAPLPSNTVGATPSDAGVAPVPAPANAPRVKIFAPAVQGSISVLGARLDDLVLRDYRETIQPDSPLVRLLEPRSDPQPYYIQFGWTGLGDVKVPDPNTTQWTASGDELTPGKPVTLSWDNGAGQTFQIAFAIDDHYMFTVQQSVRNTGGEPVQVFPWSRIRRDYTPQVAGYYILHEGLLGVIDGTLKEMKYSTAKEDGAKKDGLAYSATTTNSWAGITDKYWLTSLIPDRTEKTVVSFRDTTATVEGKPSAGYQVDYVADTPQDIAAGADATAMTRVFAGAKVVRLLTDYEDRDKIPLFSYAVDFGWFYFLTKPFFYAIDWLNGLLGNFGLAIMAFTLFVKALFFPLANKSYRSMSKMKLLAPKMQALKERYKDEPQKLQAEMMQLYKTEKVNPASGCLPMVIQIPVFFSLYKVIFVTIEMRQAPFFGWIHDLSAVDPTNVFNLFGLLPFDPTAISPWLHLGAWPLIMGCTMFFQQRLNPPPPDPVQARLFQFMPLIFTFMLARFPAGLVIYWSWNNTLTILQQWVIMRQTTLGRARVVRST